MEWLIVACLIHFNSSFYSCASCHMCFLLSNRIAIFGSLNLAELLPVTDLRWWWLICIVHGNWYWKSFEFFGIQIPDSILFLILHIHFANFPCLHCSINQRLVPWRPDAACQCVNATGLLICPCRSTQFYLWFCLSVSLISEKIDGSSTKWQFQHSDFSKRLGIWSWSVEECQRRHQGASEDSVLPSNYGTPF